MQLLPKTKALLICSPSNPTGGVYSKEELSEIVTVLEKHPNIYVISDEIYETYKFCGRALQLSTIRFY
jgi:aspartate aminotransferase